MIDSPPSKIDPSPGTAVRHLCRFSIESRRRDLVRCFLCAPCDRTIYTPGTRYVVYVLLIQARIGARLRQDRRHMPRFSRSIRGNDPELLVKDYQVVAYSLALPVAPPPPSPPLPPPPGPPPPAAARSHDSRLRCNLSLHRAPLPVIDDTTAPGPRRCDYGLVECRGLVEPGTTLHRD